MAGWYELLDGNYKLPKLEELMEDENGRTNTN